MKRLILMRHAKSSWEENAISDLARPLNDRGRAAAAAMGGWLSTLGLAPEQALISHAERCQETWRQVASRFDTEVAAETVPELYMAEPEEMLHTVRERAHGDSVLVLAHQPGTGAFARALRVDPAPHHPAFNKYPTGAVTVLDFHIDGWNELDFGSGELAHFMSPKDLPA